MPTILPRARRRIFDQAWSHRMRMLRATVKIALLLAIFAILFRHLLARHATQFAASMVLGTKVRVASLELHWAEIRIGGLAIDEPDLREQTQFSVASIRIVPSLWRGFHTGVWLDRVEIFDPHLIVRFDEQGRLQSRFPSAGESSGEAGPITIPLSQLKVAGGRVTIHRGGDCMDVVADANLAGTFSNQIEIKSDISQVAGGTAMLRTTMDAATLAGATEVQFQRCELSPTSLISQWLPPAIADEQISGTASARFKIEHLAGLANPFSHRATLKIVLQDCQCQRLGNLLPLCTISASSDASGLTANMTANPIGGTAVARLTTSPYQTPVQCDVSSQVDVPLDALANSFVPDQSINGQASLKFQSSAIWNGTIASWSSTLTTIASNLTAQGIVGPQVTMSLTSDGEFNPSNRDNGLSGTADASFRTDPWDIAEVHKELSGVVSTSGRFSLPLTRLTDPDAIVGDLLIDHTKIMMGGCDLADQQVPFVIANGQLRLAPTTLRLANDSVSLTVAAKANERLEVDAQLQSSPIELAKLGIFAARYSSKPIPIGGLASIDGKLRCNAKSMQWTASGSSQLQHATYAGVNVGSTQMDWTANPDQLILRTISPDFLGGRYDLTARAEQLDWTTAIIQAEFDDISVARLSGIAGIEMPVTGKLSGAAEISHFDSAANLRGAAKLTANGLSIYRVPIELQDSSLTIANGSCDLKTGCRMLGGSLTAGAKASLQPMIDFAGSAEPQISQIPMTFDAKVNNISVKRLASAARLPAAYRAVGGQISASLVRSSATAGEGLLCEATAVADSISLRRAKLTDVVTATVHIKPRQIELQSINGNFAGGRLSGRGEYMFADAGRGWARLAVDGINLRRLATPLGRSFQTASGTASVKLDARINRSITGRMLVSASHPSVSDLNVRAVRLPIDLSMTPSTGRLAWKMRSGLVEAGNGEINLSSSGDFRQSLNMQLAANFDRVDTSKLTRRGGFDAGIVDGSIRMWAKRADDVQDLAGTFEVNLSRIKSLEVPLLDGLQTFAQSIDLTGGSDAQNSGYLVGRLAGGMVHVDEFSLAQNNVQVLIDGTATMAGHLNLNVTASTGSMGPADGLATLANSPLLLAAPAPVTLLIKANEAIKDRVVNVHVSGTADRPLMRLQPGKQLTQDALRFFIGSQFGSNIASATMNNRAGRSNRSGTNQWR